MKNLIEINNEKEIQEILNQQQITFKFNGMEFKISIDAKNKIANIKIKNNRQNDVNINYNVIIIFYIQNKSDLYCGGCDKTVYVKSKSYQYLHIDDIIENCTHISISLDVTINDIENNKKIN